MINYSPALPYDKSGGPLQGLPAPIPAKARYVNENNTASSVISVTHDTTTIEVSPLGVSAALKWITTSDTGASVVAVAGATANYDHIIPTNTVRRFVIPIESMGAGQGSVQGANRQNGLFQRVAIKSLGVGSVLVAEF